MAQWKEDPRLFHTICGTCDGHRRIIGHHPGCDEQDCLCIEWHAWYVRCPECSPDLLPEVTYRPDRAAVPF